MNHLAHFLLAPNDVEAKLGTLLADFHRGRVGDDLPGAVAAAIRLHRAIDGTTDAQAEVLAAKSAFAPGRRRFAGLALDLYFDHCLSRRWDVYANDSLDAFVDETYAGLASALAAPYVPERMRGFAAAMRDQDWLRSYRDFAGVEAALGRLEHAFRRRFARDVALRSLADELHRNRSQCDAAFAAVFPRLLALAREVGEMGQARGMGQGNGVRLGSAALTLESASHPGRA